MIFDVEILLKKSSAGQPAIGHMLFYAPWQIFNDSVLSDLGVRMLHVHADFISKAETRLL